MENEAYELDEPQCELLKKCWGQENSLEWAADVYGNLFRAQPVMLELFPAIKRRGGAVMQNPAFLKMCKLFMEGIAELVKVCDNAEELSTQSRELGRRHAPYASRGLRPEHFQSLRTAMKAVMSKRILKDSQLKDMERSTAIQAWIAFSTFVLEEMKIGFLGIDQDPDALANIADAAD